MTIPRSGQRISLDDAVALSLAALQSILFPDEPPSPNFGIPREHVVHTDPHLDEFFAEMLFRATLPLDAEIAFNEGSFGDASEEDSRDLTGSVLFGIGGGLSLTSRPLLIFDEHELDEDGKRIYPSCSGYVASAIEATRPVEYGPEFLQLLAEVDFIDEFGSAHAQHLANFIKAFNRFSSFQYISPDDAGQVPPVPNPEVKRKFITVCLCSVLRVMITQPDLLFDRNAVTGSLLNSLTAFTAQVPEAKRSQAFQRLLSDARSLYGDQGTVFHDAQLKHRSSIVTEVSAGPQMLLVSRVCRSLEHVFGQETAHDLFRYFWDIDFQRQMSFLRVKEALAPHLSNDRPLKVETEVGELFFAKLFLRDPSGRSYPFWVLHLTPAAGVVYANQPALNALNHRNHGRGVLLLDDPDTGSKTLFRAKAVDPDLWKKLTGSIRQLEPGCWYDPSTDPGRPAPFIINGSKARKGVQKSLLDGELVAGLLRQVSES